MNRARSFGEYLTFVNVRVIAVGAVEPYRYVIIGIATQERLNLVGLNLDGGSIGYLRITAWGGTVGSEKLSGSRAQGDQEESTQSW